MLQPLLHLVDAGKGARETDLLNPRIAFHEMHLFLQGHQGVRLLQHIAEIFHQIHGKLLDALIVLHLGQAVDHVEGI